MAGENKTTESKVPCYHPSSPMFHGIAMLLSLVVAIISAFFAYKSYSQSDENVVEPIGWALIVIAIIALICCPKYQIK